MRQTWRWFGPKDLASVDDMLQAGVEGVASALHHVPNGVVWTPEEIAKRIHMTPERVREIQKISREPVSMETPVGDEEDSSLGDFIRDDMTPHPADEAARTMLREQIREILSDLTEREQQVLRLRYGLDDDRSRTLEEVGRQLNVTRERIRQIEAKALRKLKRKNIRMRDYLE